MGIAEDVQEVADRLNDQERWGLDTTHIMLRVLWRAVRAVALRADARADALEARVSAIESKIPPQ